MLFFVLDASGHAQRAEPEDWGAFFRLRGKEFLIDEDAGRFRVVTSFRGLGAPQGSKQPKVPQPFGSSILYAGPNAVGHDLRLYHYETWGHAQQGHRDLVRQISTLSKRALADNMLRLLDG